MLAALLLASPLLAGPVAAEHGPDPVSHKVARELRHAPPVPRTRAGVGPADAWRRGDRMHVYVRVTGVDPGTLETLRRRGLEIVTASDAFGGLVDGWTDVATLDALADLPAVTMIRPVAPPITQAGAVVSAGDAGLGADAVRAAGWTGAGVVLGLISDGIDSLARSQAAGELPAVTVPSDPRCNAFGGDEGTAMLEIVHDVAPGAALLFGSFGQSGAQMGETVRCLADAGARVIVDDVTFPDEPFFQDGPLANAAREVVGRGVSYHTSAGNRRREFMEHALAPAFYGPPLGVIHDFGAAAGGPGDPGNEIRLAPGGGATCALQWDEPFGGAGTDLDLVVVQGSAANVIAQSTNPQTGTQDPVEVVSIGNPTSTEQVVSLVVTLFSGNPARTIRLVCFRSVHMEHVSLEGAIYGQQSPPEVVAVASIDVADPGHDTIEAESSPGPATIRFPAFEIREKPDLASFDGVATSVPGFETFFGTSAAAPHAGAVAALMLGKNPTLSPAQVKQLMQATAVDIEAPGFDRLSGAGRLDARAAVGAVPCLDAAALPAQATCAGERPPKPATAGYRAARASLVAPVKSARKTAKRLTAAGRRLAKGLRIVDKKSARGALGAGCAAELRAQLSLVGRALVCRLAG
ncbi:MAG: S8 family serine peptidase [bacterium]|nr:S8 family serine peptidase [bacterium]